MEPDFRDLIIIYVFLTIHSQNIIAVILLQVHNYYTFETEVMNASVRI